MRYLNYKTVFKAIALVGFLVSFGGVEGAYALSLDDARKQGLVRENCNTGFLEAKSSKAKGLVEDVNEQRLKEYKRLAKSNEYRNLSDKEALKVVQKIAGRKLCKKYGSR